MATTQEAIDELKTTVGELATEFGNLLTRLEQAKDDPQEIGAITAELRPIVEQMRSLGQTP